MVYVIFKEKFHGKSLKGTYARKFKNLKQAQMEVKLWNSLTEQDQIKPIAVTKEKPKGFVKNKSGVLQKKK